MYITYLDRRVVGSFITMTSVMSPYLVKYSLRLSETIKQIISYNKIFQRSISLVVKHRIISFSFREALRNVFIAMHICHFFIWKCPFTQIQAWQNVASRRKSKLSLRTGICQLKLELKVTQKITDANWN